MTWDPDLQNNNQIYNQYTPGGYEKAKIKKILMVGIGVFLAIIILVFIVHLSHPESQQSKYTKAATAAARKHTPDVTATHIKVAGGFATALVSGPAAQGQANTGYTTIFKVNKDGSMVQLAKGGSFGPIDLLQLGVPLATQAKLTGISTEQAMQNLANQCGYSGGNAPGYIGFNSSFNPGGWQIDAATLDSLEQALTTAVSNKNVPANYDEKVICVNATVKNSNATTDTQTYISTFTLELQFITGNGTLTSHTFTFATGPNYYRSYTLDGQSIQTT